MCVNKFAGTSLSARNCFSKPTVPPDSWIYVPDVEPSIKFRTSWILVSITRLQINQTFGWPSLEQTSRRTGSLMLSLNYKVWSPQCSLLSRNKLTRAVTRAVRCGMIVNLTFLRTRKVGFVLSQLCWMNISLVDGIKHLSTTILHSTKSIS